MPKFATEFANNEFLQRNVAKLPWAFVTTIMDQAKAKRFRVSININRAIIYLLLFIIREIRE